MGDGQQIGTSWALKVLNLGQTRWSMAVRDAQLGVGQSASRALTNWYFGATYTVVAHSDSFSDTLVTVGGGSHTFA